jgi:DNA-binding NarL/FixJ family response regulator
MFPTHPLRIFLVEDSAVLRERLAESLGSMSGVQIVGTSDTEESAVNALRNLQCDVVVLDLQLKQGNGFNVLKAIRHSESVEHKKVVVVLTNYAFSLYRHRCLQAGADFFLDKAREYERLPQVLEAMAEGRAALQDQ